MLDFLVEMCYPISKLRTKGGTQMKLSMWIIANLVESFEPEVNIRADSPRILRSARLAHATDCVYVRQDDNDCLYCWGSDTIRLPDLSAREGFELLQTLFDSMYDWHSQLVDAIEQKNFQQVIDLCYRVLRNPATLTDANRCCLAATSRYGTQDLDNEWFHMRTYGYSSLEATMAMTEAQVSYHFSDHLIRYKFENNSLLCDCVTAPILRDDFPVGYLTVQEKEHPLNYGHMQLLSMIAQLLSPVLFQETEISDQTVPYLKLLLEGTPIPANQAQKFYTQKKWSPEHTFRAILFDFHQAPDTGTLRRNYSLIAPLAAVFPEDLCGIYDGKFVIIANDTLLPQEQRRIRLERQLQSLDATVAVSLPFPGLKHVPHLYDQACFALEYGKQTFPDKMFLEFYYLAIDYLIRSPYRPGACLTACHPDVYALYRYDEILYRTLWVYLIQDRSVTRTIQHLHVHKNTLLYRLRKIEEFLRCDINDPYSREYMRLSFALLERHAGLSRPPESPFPKEETEDNQEL